jgi:hypothetical protein
VRRLLSLLALAAVGIGVSACGGAKGVHSASNASAQLSADSQNPQHFMGDGDFDRGDRDGDNNSDVEQDPDTYWDYYTRADVSWNRGRYHDHDDIEWTAFGHAASGADAQAISTLVTRYYVAAARDDGRAACAMLLPRIAKSLLNYYRGGWPPYLAGSKTCQAAMNRYFRHVKLHPVTVTDVRVRGHEAVVLWGSRMMPAGFIGLLRQHGAWSIAEPVGSPLR